MGEEENIQPGQEEQAQATEPSEVDLLRAKVAELEDNVAQLKDQLLRKAADFENYKKRVENDFAAMVKYANEDLITVLLPVLDDFHRSIRMGQEKREKNSQEPKGDAQSNANDGEAFLRGMELIYDKLMKILEAQGVQHIEVVGKPFDPYYHDALLQVPRKDVPPHTVVEEVDKGYLLHEKVIRHARVIVAADEEQPNASALENKPEQQNENNSDNPSS